MNWIQTARNQEEDVPQSYLVELEGFNVHVFRSDEFMQACKKFGADAGGEVGEFDLVTAAAFVNHESKAIHTGVRYQNTISMTHADVVAHFVAALAQDDCQHAHLINIRYGRRRQDVRHGAELASLRIRCHQRYRFCDRQGRRLW